MHELAGTQGSVRFICWTSTEPKLAVSVTSVNQQSQLFFGLMAYNFLCIQRPQNLHNDTDRALAREVRRREAYPHHD
jgi:hypothetical protein